MCTKKKSLNPFKRNKSINQKPSPLETVISKTRPRMLPPKNPQEEKKHLQEYENMMKKARKLEAKKQKEHYRKKEEKDKKTINAIQIWENEIIPQWKSKVKDKRTRQLWDQGVPPRCRKKVWRLKIGNELNITRSIFLECQRRVPQAVRTKDQPVTQKSSDSSTTLASESPSYRSRRQRRTSSLDVLREHEDQIRLESDGRRSSLELRPSSSTSYSYQTESDYNPEENHKRADSFSGRSAMELESNRTSNDDDDDDNIELEDDDDDDDTTSQEDEGEEGDDDEKILTDPTAINFLNKAIDEDILRTLPSLCVFQVQKKKRFKKKGEKLNYLCYLA